MTTTTYLELIETNVWFEKVPMSDVTCSGCSALYRQNH